MKRSDFFFELPEALIAQFPPAERGRSRLMVLDRLKRTRLHRMTADLPELLEPGSLLVFNNSRVRKARLYGRSALTGGRAVFLLLNKADPLSWRVMAQRAKRRRPGSRYLFEDGVEGEIADAEGEFRLLRFNRPIDDEWLDRYGHVPLPPYIKREDLPSDSGRYQTVYAGPPGSAAAPTAGLHFTGELLSRLEAAGMENVFITLHVGLGTFLPVRTEHIEDHRMHEESFSIDEDAAVRIEKAKAGGRKIVAVGTTSVRTLESAWQIPPGGGPGSLRRGEGSTSIFIYPGRRFNVVDALFTNFHTPESTLLMLAAAFAEAKTGAFSGRDFILESYAEAIRENYRFFSYGDAMLIV
ncbi:MAG: tRNA preQ1(34) S-adenosylmethionine ribosyltransferase-isomerase QueA [Treponema sp.]|jgi:S-adenosylmethionine:tRNA ribosyltransferase-isomerase|nr:tRNA preQ1(34) S-adenosylmethionine ribosyltransferase-isomerase QueA [Treponema sp.]